MFESSVAHLRQILQQLMRTLGASDMLEIDGCVVSDARFNDRVLRLGVSSTFNLDLQSVQRTRPDLNAFHHWINEYMHHEEDSSIQGELFDVIRRVSQLKGVIDTKWVTRIGHADVTVFTVHVFIPKGPYYREALTEEKRGAVQEIIHMADKEGIGQQPSRSISSQTSHSNLIRNSELPLRDAPAVSIHARNSRSNEDIQHDTPRRLLLVDDNNFVLDVVEMQLCKYLDQQGLGDIQVDTCSEEVLDFLLSHEDYGLVFMDLNFPGTPEDTLAGTC